MMPDIDFQKVREYVSMAQVLELLEFVPVHRRGDQVRGPCPLHGEVARQRSFSAHLARNAFRCFRCGAAGNQLDLWAAAHRLTAYDSVPDGGFRADHR